ncbi:hypothetical protein D3C75_1315430 [compost metagenome]
MKHLDLTPETVPCFVDDQAALPIPVFVTLESHRRAKAQIRQKIAAATADDSKAERYGTD